MLDILSKYHSEWLKIVKSFGAKYPEDIIQDFYIKMLEVDPKKLVIDGEPNRAYIWVTLRNAVYLEKTFNYVELDDRIPDESEEYNEELDELIDKTESIIDTFNDYEKRLFNIYVQGNISGKKLADATGINKYSIYRSIRKCKQKIKDEILL